MNGAYAIRAAGLYQFDKDEFMRSDGVPTPGYRDWRGAVETNGQFALNQRWVWGWDGLLVTDKTFYQDYNPNTFTSDARNPFQSGRMEGISQLYLTGRGSRSFFDARSIYYYGFSEFDNQKEMPVIHPVDRLQICCRPAGAGRRTRIQIQPDQPVASVRLVRPDQQHVANDLNYCGTITADTAVKNTTNCVMRGAPGNYTRFSAEAEWKKSLTDPLGMVWTPFFKLRADVTQMNLSNEPGVSNFIDTSNTQIFRGMPTAGLEWRYPFINVQSWGTNTLEPIVQVIARPNEQQIGKIPNEDAQSFVFDDGNLFRVDKFAGWDRVEGGGRVNYGATWTTQFNQGGFFNVLFGQSYQMFGVNSFAAHDTTNTGLDSGLDTKKSDYVARVAYQPDRILTFTTRYRFDQDRFEVKRFELEGVGQFRPPVAAGPVRQLCRPAGNRLPGSPRGHSGRRILQAQRQLGRDRRSPL